LVVDKPDAGWNAEARGETTTERMDRNWNDLLQELRVSQTGVQLLTGLLLTLPFQSRFTQLTGLQHTVYLITVACSVASTGFLIAPVSMHRALFRQRARRALVEAGHVLAIIGLALLGLAVTGVVCLIFGTVLRDATGICRCRGHVRAVRRPVGGRSLVLAAQGPPNGRNVVTPSPVAPWAVTRRGSGSPANGRASPTR
jgi:hypothetical protein